VCVVLEHWIEESELWGLVKRREMKEEKGGDSLNTERRKGLGKRMIQLLVFGLVVTGVCEGIFFCFLFKIILIN
jgi:hypothetical protein